MKPTKPALSFWALCIGIGIGVIAPHADAGSVVADVAGDLQGAGIGKIGSPVKPPPRPIKPPPPPEKPVVPEPPVKPAPPPVLPVPPPTPKLPPVPGPINNRPGVMGPTPVEPGQPVPVTVPGTGQAPGVKTQGPSGGGQSVVPAITNGEQAIPLSPLESVQPVAPGTSGNEGKRPANRKGRTSATPKQ